MNREVTELDFEYFISEKNGFVVASLIGTIGANVEAKLRELQESLAQRQEAKRVAINLRDVSSISKDCIPLLAMMQKTVRDKNASLRVCGLKPEIKEQLEKAGILRPNEISDNLQTALQSFMANIKRAA